jgi:protein-L-isoaspartate O-methyltransferase
MKGAELFPKAGSKRLRSSPSGRSILVTAAPAEVPEVLLAQLAPGGRLVMPVGPDGRQRLLRYTRRGTVCEPEDLGAVSFVPMLAGVVGSLGNDAPPVTVR